ncbi:MAG: hypothetical protein AB7L09_12715 [Nitrospira sp.]
MDPLDRFQALIRHPDYHRNIPLSLIRSLKNGLRPFLLTGLLSETRIPLEDKIRAVQLLEEWGIHHTVDPGASKDQYEEEITKLKSGSKVSLFKDDPRARITDGKSPQSEKDQQCFLTITLDLRTPSSKLVPLLESIIARERGNRKVKIRKRDEHKVDPWIVWDLMQTPGNTLLKITRQLFPVSGNPAHDDSDDNPIAACYAKVKRAYQKAESLIKEVGNTRSNRLSGDQAIAKSVVELSLACNELLKDFIAASPGYKMPKIDPNKVIDLFPARKPLPKSSPPSASKRTRN